MIDPLMAKAARKSFHLDIQHAFGDHKP